MATGSKAGLCQNAQSASYLPQTLVGIFGQKKCTQAQKFLCPFGTFLENKSFFVCCGDIENFFKKPL